MTVVYRHYGGNALGDAWRITQWLLRKSEESGESALVSRHFPINRDGGPENIRELIPRAAALLDSTGTVQLVDHSGPTVPIDGEIWGPLSPPYMRLRDSRYRWDGGSAGTICHQFDGVSCAGNKNPPPQDIPLVTQWPNMVRLGLPLTIEESLAELARCRLFVGVCSGISHLAHSVGCPMILIEYRQKIAPWHPDPQGVNPWIGCHGTQEAIGAVNYLLGLYA
jgi:hypothetical protein